MRWVYELLFSNQRVATQILVASFFINLFGLASAIYVMQVYGRYLMHGITTTLITLLFGMLIVVLFEYIFKHIRYNIVSNMIAQRDSDGILGIFDTLLSIRADEFIKIKESIKRVILSKSDEMYTTLNTSLFITIIDTPFAIMYIVAIFFISAYVGWIVLLLIVTTLIIAYLRSLKVSAYTKESIDTMVSRQNYALSIEHTELIKANRAKSLLQQKYKDSYIDSSRYKKLIQQEQTAIISISHSMTMLLSALVIAFGASEVVEGNIDFGMLIGINMLATKAMSTLTKPTTYIATLLKQNDTKEYIQRYLNLPKEKTNGIKLDEFGSDILIKDMYFGYGNGTILQNINIDIKSGSLVKIVGANGSGKSTLCRLLSGMYTPNMGHIVASGVDLRQIDSDYYSSKISYIPQEPEFVNSTIRDNIILLDDSIDDSRLSQIIIDADLQNFVNLSEDGINMQITNSGKNFPVGIRRRLSLARAIANDGDIVIVDEPSDGLDSAGIKAIANYINKSLQKKKTVIIATHAQNLMNNETILIELHNKIAKVTYR
jgi:ATP-binding cassette subfamily C protein LapB